MLSAGISARSWYTVSIPTLRASRGELNLTWLPVEPDLALVGRVEPVHHLNQSGLTGTIVADQADDLAPRHLEDDALNRDDIAEVHRDVVELEKLAGVRVAVMISG